MGACLHLWIWLGQRMDEGKVQVSVVESASEAPILPFGFASGLCHLAGFLLGGEALFGFLRHRGTPCLRAGGESAPISYTLNLMPKDSVGFLSVRQTLGCGSSPVVLAMPSRMNASISSARASASASPISMSRPM